MLVAVSAFATFFLLLHLFSFSLLSVDKIVAKTTSTHGTQVGAGCQGCLPCRGNRKKCKSHTLCPCCGANPPLTNKGMVCGPTVSWSGRGRRAKPRCPSPYPPRVHSEPRHSESPTPAPAHRATRKFKTINAENPQIQVGFTTKLTIPNLGNMDPNAGGGTGQASGLPPLAWHVLPPYLGVNTATLPSPQFRPTRSAL